MFASLNEYKEQSYYDSHPQMYLVTPDGGYLCDIFAAFEAKPKESGSDTSPWRMEWKDDGAYTTWLSAMADRSVVETDVTVTSSDKVLTLSTCTPAVPAALLSWESSQKWLRKLNNLRTGAGADAPAPIIYGGFFMVNTIVSIPGYVHLYRSLLRFYDMAGK